MNTPDPEILSRIGQLVDEERTLRRGHRETPLEPSALERLEQIEVQLDQCWDLLNQRRALAEYGLDPDAATLRDESTVEGYEQ